MKTVKKIGYPLFIAILSQVLIAPLQAEIGKQPFKINGKAVPKVVARVNGAELQSDFLEREMVAFKMMSVQRGREVKPESEDKIARNILEKKIDEELIYQKARRAGIQVPSEIILKEIKNIENQFPSPGLFERALAMQHLTRGALREKIERQLVAEKYLRQVIVPKVNMEALSPEDYYKNNPSSFMKPEMYEISHIFVSLMDLSSQEKVTDPEAKNKAQRILDGINKEVRDKIDSVALKLKKGEEFNKLAKIFSEDEATRDKGGSLGILVPQTTIPEIAAVMTGLTLGETSQVIQSSFGFHIVKLNNKIPSQLASYEEVKSDILNLLLVQETEKLKEELLAVLKKSAEIKRFI